MYSGNMRAAFNANLKFKGTCSFTFNTSTSGNTNRLSIAQNYTIMRERVTNKTSHPEESSKQSTRKLKCKKCWDRNRDIVCHSNELSI